MLSYTAVVITGYNYDIRVLISVIYSAVNL